MSQQVQGKIARPGGPVQNQTLFKSNSTLFRGILRFSKLVVMVLNLGHIQSLIGHLEFVTQKVWSAILSWSHSEYLVGHIEWVI